MTATTIGEYWTVKPVDQLQYTTLEFRNASAGVRRFVTAQQEAKSFQLESTAPVDAGLVVEFEPVAFQAPEPEQGAQGGVSLDIQMGAIGFEAKQYLTQVFAAWPPTIDVVWRRHLEGVTEPVQVFYLQAKPSIIEGVSVAISCSQSNPAGRDISRIYKFDEFPGLALSR